MGQKGILRLTYHAALVERLTIYIYISLKAYLPEDAEVFVGEPLAWATEILKNSTLS